MPLLTMSVRETLVIWTSPNFNDFTWTGLHMFRTTVPTQGTTHFGIFSRQWKKHLRTATFDYGYETSKFSKALRFVPV